MLFFVYCHCLSWPILITFSWQYHILTLTKVTNQQSFKNNKIISWYHNGPYYDIMNSFGHFDKHYIVARYISYTITLKIKYTPKYFFSNMLSWNEIVSLNCRIKEENNLFLTFIVRHVIKVIIKMFLSFIIIELAWHYCMVLRFHCISITQTRYSFLLRQTLIPTVSKLRQVKWSNIFILLTINYYHSVNLTSLFNPKPCYIFQHIRPITSSV